jgi:hypothetical protein
VHPSVLQRSLREITKDLRRTDPQWELAFTYLHQYYAEPLVTFTNTPDSLVIQIPIFLKKRNQERMNLYSVHATPVPASEKTYDFDEYEFTKVDLNTHYLAASQQEFAEFSEPQLRLCTQFGTLYLCEQTNLVHARSSRTCLASLFYGTTNAAIDCNATYVSGEVPEPEILDAGTQLVLANIPPPWHVTCLRGRPVQFKHVAFTVINKTEFCDCDLTAGNFYIPRVMTDCASVTRDNTFVSEYYHNKLLYDFLKIALEERETDPREMENELELARPTKEVPQIEKLPYKIAALDSSVQKKILNQKKRTFRRDLRGFITDIKDNGDQTFYHSEVDYLEKGEEFAKKMSRASKHDLWTLIADVLSYACFAAVIVLGVYMCMIKWKHTYSRSAEGTGLNVGALASLMTMREAHSMKLSERRSDVPLLPTVDPWDVFEDDFDTVISNQENEQAKVGTMQKLYIILGCVFIIWLGLALYRRLRRKSSLWRVCFPMYPVSAIKRGVPHTDIFVQMVEAGNGKTLIAHVGVCCEVPQGIIMHGILGVRNIQIRQTCLCFKYLAIDWSSVTMTTSTYQTIKLSGKAPVSIWTPNNIKLDQAGRERPYTVTVLARFLDMYQPVKTKSFVRNAGESSVRSQIEEDEDDIGPGFQGRTYSLVSIPSSNILTETGAHSTPPGSSTVVMHPETGTVKGEKAPTAGIRRGVSSSTCMSTGTQRKQHQTDRVAIEKDRRVVFYRDLDSGSECEDKPVKEPSAPPRVENEYELSR